MSRPAFDGVYVLGKELRRDRDRAIRELRARSAAAAVAWRRGVPTVLALEAPLRGQEVAGSTIIADFLDGLGVPRSAMVLAEVTRSTREEAIAARREVQARGWSRLLVVTSAYHVPRARHIFEDVLGRGRVAVHTPEAFWRGATPQECQWIRAGAPDPAVLRQEQPVERVLLALARTLGRLPPDLRWSVEVQAGALLRRADRR